MFTLLVKYYCMFEENSIKTFVGPEIFLHVIQVTASSDVTRWLRCIVGYVGTMFLKERRMSEIKQVMSLVYAVMISINWPQYVIL